MSVIFVCGVHGIGKTTFCQRLAKSLNIPHFSASTLIRDKASYAVSEKSGDKQVKEIDANQVILLAAVREKIAEMGRIILDGHVTLIDKAGSYQKLPIALFRDLGVSTIILLEIPAPESARRLTERDGMAPSLDFIAEHQKVEKEHAQELADKINVRLYISNGENEQLQNILEKL